MGLPHGAMIGMQFLIMAVSGHTHYLSCKKVLPNNTSYLLIVAATCGSLSYFLSKKTLEW